MVLSKRGVAACIANPIWEKMCNLYDPQTNPDGIYSLGVAENSLMHAEMLEFINNTMALPAVGLTYGDGGVRVRKSLERFLNKHLKPFKPLEPHHFAITNGCGPAIEHAIWMLANPGESILLGRPYYSGFTDDITRRTGCKLAEVAFDDVDPLCVASVDKYEDRLQQVEADGDRVRCLILCHPHNPLGRCYSRDALIAIIKFCQKHDIHLISDEIYALSLFENTIDRDPRPVPFESILSIDIEAIIDPNLVHIIWGTAKDFGSSGIRFGAIISQHNTDISQIMANVGYYTSTSSLTEHITANILDDDEWVSNYIQENQRKLRQGYEYVTAWANEQSIPYARGANAGFFLWLDLGSIYLKHHPEAKEFDIDQLIYHELLRNRVLLGAGFHFGAEKPGWFRIVFTHEIDYLDECLRRIVAVLKNERF